MNYLILGSLTPATQPTVTEFYNISQDPYEKNNLVNERSDIVDSLRKRLAEIEKEIRPAGPVQDMPKRALIYGETETKTFKGWNK